MIILILIASGICAGCGIFCRLVFKWGNKGKRFKRRVNERKAAVKDLQKALVVAEQGGEQLTDADRMRLAYQKAQEARKNRTTKKTFREMLDKCRLITAWAVNFAFYLIMTWFVITYAMMFGPEKTKGWLMSWTLASGNAWLVVEPMEVLPP